jgi:hypothetical protein
MFPPGKIAFVIQFLVKSLEQMPSTSLLHFFLFHSSDVLDLSFRCSAFPKNVCTYQSVSLAAALQMVYKTQNIPGGC